MPSRKLPPIDELKRLASSMTQQEIADHLTATLGVTVTRSAVSVAMSRAGLTEEKPRYIEYLPWQVHAEHLKQYPAVMLRAYARMQAKRPIDDELKNRVRNWLAGLAERKVVVHYTPARGFHYVDAREGDDVIRRTSRTGPPPPTPARTRAKRIA